MSFASGLFSFMGGASTQFREEIDLENARKAAKAEADAEAIKEQARLNEELRQFNITSDLSQQKIDISKGELEVKKDTEKRLGYEFEKNYGFRLNEFEWEKNVYNKDYTLERDKYLTNKKDIEEKLKLAKNKDERDAILLDLKEEEFKWTQKQDEIQNQFKIDDLEFEKYKLEVETHADTLDAMKEAEEGIIKFGPDLQWNKGSFSDKDQPTSFLTWADDNLTKEKIDALAKSSPEGITLLKTEFNNAITNLIDRSYKDSGDIITLVQSDQYLNAIAMSKYLGEIDLKEAVKQKTMSENPDADTAIVEAQQTDEGEVIIKGTAVTYENLAKSNGFETGEELTTAIDSLVDITRKKEVNAIYEDDLNPFESRETLIASLTNKNIPLTVLRLSEEINNIQEAVYGDIGIATDYDALVQKAFEFGILTRDANGHIQGESQLIDFIFMMQPKKEYTIVNGIKQTPASTDPKRYGLEDTVNAEDAKAQNNASRTAMTTAIKLKDVLNDPSSDKIGLALNIAAKVYGITTQYEQLSALWGGTRNNFGASLQTGDGSNSAETGGVSQAKLDEISKEIATAQSTLNSSTKESAKKKAKMTLLKFTLAYQVSMALQGGSGGRTISDQDVENILQSLAMPDTFFSTATKESTTASLDTLTEFLESIELQSRYLSQNTMKGYRAYVASINVISALNNYGGVGNDLEDFKNQMNERTGNNEVTMTEGGEYDWDSNYSNYRKTWIVDFTSNGSPVYVMMENGKPNPKESYLMDTDDYNTFLTTAQKNNNSRFDEQKPNFSLDVSREMYRGSKVKGLFSDLLTQEDDLGV